MRRSSTVLVVGGGPSGSTAATFLARNNVDVTILERDFFPRYHVGESLSLSVVRMMDLLGVSEKLNEFGFRHKAGSYYEWGDEKWDLPFTDVPGGKHSWQVTRADFDKILLDHAREEGVEVHEGHRVTEVRFDGDRAVAAQWKNADGETGEIEFDYLIDASGRAGLLAQKYFKNRRMHDVFRNIGVWSYWKGAHDIPEGPDGAVSVCSVPEGWIWIIPLHNGITSIGLVTDKKSFYERRKSPADVEAIYNQAVHSHPLVERTIAGAKRVSKMHTETDYSYVADSFTGPGYLISGDSACFLDPLLSTGVHLATFSGMLAAATVTSIVQGDVSEKRGLKFYETAYRYSYERLLVLVSVFYDSYRGKDDYFYRGQSLTRGEQRRLHIHEAFLSIIAGVEDLADATTADAYQAIEQALHGGEQPGAVPPTRVHSQSREWTLLADSVANTIEGMYMTMEPSVRLHDTSE
ncbi:NAD(P)/FAD-dependent oxidoreductase [Actinoplanes aureus]|uniref:Tryptophan 7-halogenase n=1 Tax=Actinoplanes aureus TaxID=2792083 RepID=A0A931C8D1_9ACTN|nr:NAD(P)/FAD-dependent oxidoreductase [Actinoplanes aureus]MBG0560215.1 tryptophan 7-halogenase [Actinoplanes aureus]